LNSSFNYLKPKADASRVFILIDSSSRSRLYFPQIIQSFTNWIDSQFTFLSFAIEKSIYSQLLLAFYNLKFLQYLHNGSSTKGIAKTQTTPFQSHR